jgi:hypothetical protein
VVHVPYRYRYRIERKQRIARDYSSSKDFTDKKKHFFKAMAQSRGPGLKQIKI